MRPASMLVPFFESQTDITKSMSALRMAIVAPAGNEASSSWTHVGLLSLTKTSLTPYRG